MTSPFDQDNVVNFPRCLPPDDGPQLDLGIALGITVLSCVILGFAFVTAWVLYALFGS